MRRLVLLAAAAVLLLCTAEACPPPPPKCWAGTHAEWRPDQGPNGTYVCVPDVPPTPTRSER